MTKNAAAVQPTAKTTPAPKSAQPLKKVEKEAEEVKAQEVKKTAQAPKPMTAQERLKQLPKLQKLADKLDKLEESKTKLENFKIGSDGSQDTLILSGSMGSDERFLTSNSALIADVVKVLFATIDQKMSETEAQIEALSI